MNISDKLGRLNKDVKEKKTPEKVLSLSVKKKKKLTPPAVCIFKSEKWPLTCLEKKELCSSARVHMYRKFLCKGLRKIK